MRSNTIIAIITIIMIMIIVRLVDIILAITAVAEAVPFAEQHVSEIAGAVLGGSYYLLTNYTCTSNCTHHHLCALQALTSGFLSAVTIG